MIRLALALLVLFGLVAPAAAERLVSKVSRDEVSITSSFQGELLTLFGSIEPAAGSEQRYVEGPFHVVITVTGPLQNRVVRRKTNTLGIWINTEEVMFSSFPAFYHVLADARLSDITDPMTLAEKAIPLDSQTRYSARAGWWDSLVYGSELVRLMQKSGQFRLNEQGVVFNSNTFYSAQVQLPSDAPPGPYLARTYLFKDGQIVAERSDGFFVRKVGFERFLGLAARQQPFLYGLVCVVLALFTGWLGGVVFKR